MTPTLEPAPYYKTPYFQSKQYRPYPRHVLQDCTRQSYSIKYQSRENNSRARLKNERAHCPGRPGRLDRKSRAAAAAAPAEPLTIGGMRARAPRGKAKPIFFECDEIPSITGLGVDFFLPHCARPAAEGKLLYARAFMAHLAIFRG